MKALEELKQSPWKPVAEKGLDQGLGGIISDAAGCASLPL